MISIKNKNKCGISFNKNNGNDEPPFKKQKLDTVVMVPDYLIKKIINYALESIQLESKQSTLNKFIDIRNLKFSLISKQFFKVTKKIISQSFYYYHNNKTIQQFIKYNKKEYVNRLTFYRQPPLYLEYKILKLITKNKGYFISKVETFKIDCNDIYDQNYFKYNIYNIPYFPSLKYLFLINLKIRDLHLYRKLINHPKYPKNFIEKVSIIFKNQIFSPKFINFFNVLFKCLSKQLKLLVLENVDKTNHLNILEYLKKKELSNDFILRINNTQYIKKNINGN